MKINRKKFYTEYRKVYGKLNQKQVDSIECIFNEIEASNITDIRWVAYMFATVYHETAATMLPIEEYGKGKCRKYGTIYTNTKGVKYGIAGSGGDTYLYSDYPHLYYGRGHTQNTWLDNYKYIKQRTGVDVVNNPNLLLDSKLSAEVTVLAMKEGWYTSKKLSDYINDSKNDYVGARRIVNGNDKAKEIADIAVVMERALRSY